MMSSSFSRGGKIPTNAQTTLKWIYIQILDHKQILNQNI